MCTLPCAHHAQAEAPVYIFVPRGLSHCGHSWQYNHCACRPKARLPAPLRELHAWLPPAITSLIQALDSYVAAVAQCRAAAVPAARKPVISFHSAGLHAASPSDPSQHRLKLSADLLVEPAAAAAIQEVLDKLVDRSQTCLQARKECSHLQQEQRGDAVLRSTSMPWEVYDAAASLAASLASHAPAPSARKVQPPGWHPALLVLALQDLPRAAPRQAISQLHVLRAAMHELMAASDGSALAGSWLAAMREAGIGEAIRLPEGVAPQPQKSAHAQDSEGSRAQPAPRASTAASTVPQPRQHGPDSAQGSHAAEAIQGAVGSDAGLPQGQEAGLAHLDSLGTCLSIIVKAATQWYQQGEHVFCHALCCCQFGIKPGTRPDMALLAQKRLPRLPRVGLL